MPYLYWRPKDKHSNAYRPGKTPYGKISHEGKVIFHESIKTEDGKKIKDPTLAKQRLKEIEYELVNKQYVPKSSRSVKDILKEYEKYCLTRKTRKTYQTDRKHIDDYIKWAAPQRVKDITKKSIQDYLDFRLTLLDSTEHYRKIIKQSANSILIDIKALLNFAQDRSYINENPAKGIKNYKVDSLPPKFLLKEEVKEILKSAKKEILYIMIATAVYTGLRLGELKRLIWGNINFQRDEVMVMRAKSKKFRIVPLSQNLKKILKPFRKKDTELCFDTANMRRVFRRIIKASKVITLCDHCKKENAKISDRRKGLKICRNCSIGWHTFRHTFASHAVMNGVDLVTVSKWLGHADIETTMIYSHLSQEHSKRAIRKINF